MTWVEWVFFTVYTLILTYIFIGVRQEKKQWREEKLAQLEQLKKLAQLDAEMDQNLSAVRELISAAEELVDTLSGLK